MIKVQIGSVEVQLNKNEAKEVERLQMYIGIEKDAAQRIADIWMRSSNNDAKMKRRKAAVKALGLSDEIKFL